jgi:hypothetical protein
MEGVTQLAFERHFTPKQLSELWGLSERSIQRAFENQPGVLKANFRRLSTSEKPHVSLRIPESVALRVHAQWSSARRIPGGRRK